VTRAVATESQKRTQGAGVAIDATRSQKPALALPAALERCSLLQELAARGIRMTAQRRLLVTLIQESPKHLDAATLLELARKRDSEIDRATVYRTLGLLKKLRLVEELDLMHLEGEKHFYEARTNRDHLHLACFRCGAIIEYASEGFDALKQEIARKHGFAINVIRLEVGGVCQDCSRVQSERGERKQALKDRKEARRPRASG
jgi:Fur family ferric uptake transcriptional regulator